MAQKGYRSRGGRSEQIAQGGGDADAIYQAELLERLRSGTYVDVCARSSLQRDTHWTMLNMTMNTICIRPSSRMKSNWKVLLHNPNASLRLASLTQPINAWHDFGRFTLERRTSRAPCLIAKHHRFSKSSTHLTKIILNRHTLINNPAYHYDLVYFCCPVSLSIKSSTSTVDRPHRGTSVIKAI